MSASVPRIFKAISLVMADIDAISKNQTNKQQGFKFRGIDDVYNELHGRLAKHGVFTVPEVLTESREERTTKSGGVLTYVIMRVKYTFYAEDGSSVSAIVVGEASDSGDKASNKAMSIAHKYALIQVLAIPTADDKDPDHSTPPETVARGLNADSNLAPKALEPAKKETIALEFPKTFGDELLNFKLSPHEYRVPFGEFKGKRLRDFLKQDLDALLNFCRIQMDKASWVEPWAKLYFFCEIILAGSAQPPKTESKQLPTL